MRWKHLQEEARRELIETQLERCENPELADIVERNIGTILKMRLRDEARKSLQDKVADAITDFSGHMNFVYLHVIFFGLWIIINTGRLGIAPFDPFPFNFLTMTVSLEAIFLSTFVLISQNRMSAAADKRADLDLQINLLAEHEITRILVLVDAIADHLGLEVAREDISELEKQIEPGVVLDEIAQKERESRGEV